MGVLANVRRGAMGRRSSLSDPLRGGELERWGVVGERRSAGAASSRQPFDQAWLAEGAVEGVGMLGGDALLGWRQTRSRCEAG